VAVVLVFGSVFHLPVKAQDPVTGAFEGTVSDVRTRARVAGALVEITNQASGITVKRRTDAQGRFYQGLLPPGIYIIRVTAPGFKPAEKEQLLLTTGPNQVIPIPVVLEPDGNAPMPAASPSPTPSATAATHPAPSASPTPPATAPTPGGEPSVLENINLSNARRSGAFTERELLTLPLGASTLSRSFDELALLLPGVAPPPQTSGSVAGPGVGPGVGTSGQFAVNGLRSRANNFMVDGSDNNDEDIGVRRQGFFALVPQPIESLKEYQVITLLAPAQYGRNIGAQVNAVSKSGGNETHGIVYGIFNSSQFNARDFFDTVGSDTPAQLRAGGRPVFVNGRPVTVTNGAGGEDSFTLANAGLAFGGPLVPSEGNDSGKGLFYFISGEGQIVNASKESSFAVPTVEERGLFGTGATGISRDPFTGAAVLGFPTTVTGDAVFSLYPFPNNPGGVYGPHTYTRELPAGGQGKVASGKVDGNFKIGERQQSITARYNFTDDFRDIPETGGALFSTLRPRVRTQNFSTFLDSELTRPGSANPTFNQIRASYGRTHLVFDERRDTEFLTASRLAQGLRPEEQKFLLNAPLLSNDTLPSSANVIYSSFFNFGVEDALGPVGQVVIAGYSPVGVDVFNFPQRRVNNTYQFADTLTVRTALHNLAFGIDVRRTELNSDLPRNSRPLITFNGSPRLVSTLQGGTELRGFYNPVDLAAAAAPSGVFQALNNGAGSAIDLRYYQQDFFAQDEWRVRPNLSLSYGLRYEYNTPPRETSGRIESSFNDPTLQLVPGLLTFIAGRSRIFDPDRNDFAPRVGVAYSPNLFGAARLTVFRAGYGIFYDQALGAVVSQSRNVFPNFLTLNSAGGIPSSFGLGFVISNPSDSFFPCQQGGGTQFVPLTQPGTLNRLNPNVPLQCLVTLNSDFPGGFEITLPERRLRMPVAHHYTFIFEQQLSGSLVFSAAYVGTQGRHLLRLTTPNLGPNALLVPTSITVQSGNPTVFGVALGPGQRIGTGGAVSGGRPVNQAGAVSIYESSASSGYNALQLQLRGRFAEPLQFQVSYTYAKAVDDVSDIFDLAGAPALPQDSLNLAAERGPANFDVRHLLTYDFTYELPNYREGRGFVGHLLSGLTLAGTGRYSSGQPFTVNSIYDVNLDGNLTDRLNTTDGLVVTGDRRQPLRLTTNDPNSLLAPIGQDGKVGRNTFRAGGVLELDLSSSKSFTIRGRQRIMLRADVFNFINRANFGIPVRFLGAPGFGQAVDTVTPGRRVQFAMKYLF
jgi:hypothetical protein